MPQQVLTIVCKLNPTPEQSQKLNGTLEAFASACNFANSVVRVPPAYTSQTCYNCLHIHPTKGKSYRSGNSFKCRHCGWKGNADFNGAKMIQILGESVSFPERAALLSCSSVR